MSDIALRVVGVGSVGTLCSLVLLQDGDANALILQGKQAGRSVLEQYGGIPQPDALVELVAEQGEGGRVVALQRILQAVSDPFLGHLRAYAGDFYVRQFNDMKGGIEMDELDDATFHDYAEICAAVLARAHAQSPRAAEVAGYIGNGRMVGEAILEWAYAYAALSRADFDAFVAAHPKPEPGDRRSASGRARARLSRLSPRTRAGAPRATPARPASVHEAARHPSRPRAGGPRSIWSSRTSTAG